MLECLYLNRIVRAFLLCNLREKEDHQTEMVGDSRLFAKEKSYFRSQITMRSYVAK